MINRNSIIIIPARISSVRLPNKPMVEIAGKPMIWHVWQRALEADIADVVVACDDTEIAEVINNAGGTAIMTDKDHQSGSDRIYQALEIYEQRNSHRYDYVVNLQGDMPTIEPGIIKSCLDVLINNKNADITTIVTKITDEEELHDPNIVKVAIEWAGNNIGKQDGVNINNGYATSYGKAIYFSRQMIPYYAQHGVHGEQQNFWHHIGIYCYRRDAIERFVSLPPSILEKTERLEQLRALADDMKIMVSVSEHSPIGVDTPKDLEFVKRFMEK